MIGFLTANWLWILLIGAMVAMHLGHGRHGNGHGGGGCGGGHAARHDGHDAGAGIDGEPGRGSSADPAHPSPAAPGPVSAGPRQPHVH